MVPVGWVGFVVVDGEGAVEVGDGGNVPRVTRRGTRQEGSGVVDEVGNHRFHELLRELSNRGGGHLGAVTLSYIGVRGRPLDFGSGSVPKSVDGVFVRCRSINTRVSLNGMWKNLLTGTSASSPSTSWLLSNTD